MKKTLFLFLFIVSLMLTGCRATESTPSTSQSVVSETPQTQIYMDSAGREVVLPAEIKAIAPSGPLAQLVLYSANPDKLAGLSSDFSEDAKKYIDEKYWSLPKFGQFYGKNASLNMEALIANAPDVIIDAGQKKDSIKEDMDALEKQLGIPAVFIESTLDKMDTTYTMLGELTGEKERAATLAAYCKQTIEQADKINKSLSDDKRVRVYMAMGDSGLNTNARGSFHAEVIEKCGVINVADVDVVSSGGGSEVSFEQVLVWNPDMLIVDSQKLYETITTESMWQELDAVKKGKVYKIPTEPYSFMWSVSRTIGIKWLGNLAYPELYNLDINNEVKNFYETFYGIDVTDKELEKIMQNAHAK